MMKSGFCILLLFISSACFAQDQHRIFEDVMRNKSLSDFENRIGFTPAHYLDPELLSIANQSFVAFFDSVRTAFYSGDLTAAEEIDEAYDALITRTREVVQKTPPKPPILGPTPKNGSCPNFGFEQGNYVGWNLQQGGASGQVPYSFQGPFTVAPGTQHVLMTSGTDPQTGIPTVNPQGGGNYSLMLGDGMGTGSLAARARRTFQVDASTAYIQYSYAVVFQSPQGHSINELPYFMTRILDLNNNVLPCGEYAVIADANNAPNYNTYQGSGGSGLYSDWSTVVVNLSAYMGQWVTLEFSVGDCSQGAHYGYAYVDASCGIGQPVVLNDTICTGDSMILTAPAGAAQYLWNNGATTNSITVNTAGTYICSLTPPQAGSCDFDVTYNIAEVMPPVADFTMSDDTICAGEEILFANASSIPPPEVISGYQWDFGNGIVTNVGMGGISGAPNTAGSFLNPQHTYSIDGTFVVEMSVVAQNGCNRTHLDTIVVLPNTVVDAGPDQSFCDTAWVTLTATVTGANSIQWSQGVTDNVPFPQLPGTSNEYILSATTSLGCSNSDTVLVAVFPLPQVDSGPDQEICEGEQVVLFGSGALTYSWNNGISDSVFFTPPMGTTTYTVVGTDLNGCTNSDQVNVTMNPLPVVDAGNDQIHCEGTWITLNGSGSPGAVWNHGVINSVPFEQDVGIEVYILSDTLPSGCFASDSMIVEILPNPVFNFEDMEICEGDSVLFDGGNAYFFEWTGGIENNTYFIPEQTNSYVVTVTEANGCTLSDTVVVTVHLNPVVDFIILDTALTTFNPITGFDNLSIGADSYQWDFGDGSGYSYAFEPSHEFPTQSGGTYEIMLTGFTDEGCMDSIKQSLTIVLDQSIYVPNTFTPNGDEFNQMFRPVINGYDENDYHLQIFNRWGELIFESYDVNIGWDGTYSEQQFAVQDGVYVWKIELGLLDSSDKEAFVGHVTVIR